MSTIDSKHINKPVPNAQSMTDRSAINSRPRIIAVLKQVPLSGSEVGLR